MPSSLPQRRRSALSGWWDCGEVIGSVPPCYSFLRPKWEQAGILPHRCPCRWNAGRLTHIQFREETYWGACLNPYISFFRMPKLAIPTMQKAHTWGAGVLHSEEHIGFIPKPHPLITLTNKPNMLISFCLIPRSTFQLESKHGSGKGESVSSGSVTQNRLGHKEGAKCVYN